MVWINPYENLVGTNVLKVVDILSLSDMLKGKSLKGQNLRSVDFSWGHYEDMDFTGADLRKSVLYGAVFVNCRFNRANLLEAMPCLTDREKAAAEYDTFENNTPIDIEGNVAKFTGCSFDDAIMDSIGKQYFKNGAPR
jgi:uncharacterized protein YjbI with pentapeptide repeats